MRKLVVLMLTVCIFSAGPAAWSDPVSNAAGDYLADLQELGRFTLGELKLAPDTITFQGVSLFLMANAWIQEKPATGTEPVLRVTAMDRNGRKIPKNTTLDYLWVLSGDKAFFVDIRHLPQTTMDSSWPGAADGYPDNIGKTVTGGFPASALPGAGNLAPLVIGVKDPTGKLRLLAGNAWITVVKPRPMTDRTVKADPAEKKCPLCVEGRETCPTCFSIGMVDGMKCWDCKGRGWILCAACKGTGHVRHP